MLHTHSLFLLQFLFFFIRSPQKFLGERALINEKSLELNISSIGSVFFVTNRPEVSFVLSSLFFEYN